MTELDEWLGGRGPLRFVVDGVLSAEECAAWIARVEAMGMESAPITTSRGFVHRPDVRNNERAMFDDVDAARALFARMRERLPATMEGRALVGLNERLRAYRYRPGQYFAPHFDGCFRRDAREESFLTVIVSLNDDFDGGETGFDDWAYAPRRGSALVFAHRQLHEGRTVTRGVKYALRTDVMYRAPPLR